MSPVLLVLFCRRLLTIYVQHRPDRTASKIHLMSAYRRLTPMKHFPPLCTTEKNHKGYLSDYRNRVGYS